MQCSDIVERLLASDDDVGVRQHVVSCAHCTAMTQRLRRLDAVLQTALVVEPPPELQRSLAALARASARPAIKPSAWEELQQRWRVWLSGVMPAPAMAVAQGFAAFLLVLASWQVFGWLNAVTPVLGDVPYAMQLVAASPALGYLGGMQVDLQNLGLWTLIGGAGWLVSESGPIGKYIANRQGQP